MTTDTTRRTIPARAPRAGWLERLTAGGSWTVFALLVLVFVAILVMNPSFGEPMSLMAFVKKAAPLIILAIGQYFVIVSGEFDLSVGSLVGAQVVIAAKLMDGEDSMTWPVMALMVVFGLAVGLVNGLVTTLLKVPSFITTLGMMLVLYGAIRLWTGGAPTGALTDGFRQWGRGGIPDNPGQFQVPYALLVVVVLGVAAALLMRRPFGRTLVATGDNDVAAGYAGGSVWWVRTRAFLLSGFMATVAAVLIGGYAGVTAQVGQGLEFMAITAVVLGGVVLGGGRGTVIAAMAGALTLEALFTLFNQLSLPSTIRPAVQGVIIIAAVAYAALPRRSRRRSSTPDAPPAAGPTPAPKEPAPANA
ncbi:ABC transporter permease [Cellulosimicrobium cellulans]|uniref:ABC transporter permease n=1 Tax=Cellulosimicrobium TaxID=157920 RepID=UPI00088BBFEA|nr:ABC transporter permease [Sphaerisporangium cinnabarinum]MCR1981479.1 ABC transporter permease [Cellulosimicrobium cellulans]PTU55879.1 ABC transporter permease [Sphaerisporangium cinnabarinum]SDF63481.1 monosaccharide ABC transporter membrane protein, CUT2 family [Cellulosimicrobium cellulans]